MPSGTDLEQQIPFDDPAEEGEKLAATLCALFRADGYDFGVSLLANSAHDLTGWFRRSDTSDNGAFYIWRISAPPRLFVEYKRQINWGGDFHARAWFLGHEVLMKAGLQHEGHIEVEPLKDNDPDWRRRYVRDLTAEGTNNQGNVVATNRPRIVHDELFFRTSSETCVHDALLRRGIPFMPLPVVMRADGTTRPDKITHRRIEPDFVLLYRSKVVIIEIDGGSHDTQSPVEADERVRFLRERGALVHRIHADKCKDGEAAMLAVSDALKTLDREIDAQR